MNGSSRGGGEKSSSSQTMECRWVITSTFLLTKKGKEALNCVPATPSQKSIDDDHQRAFHLLSSLYLFAICEKREKFFKHNLQASNKDSAVGVAAHTASRRLN